MCTGLMWRRTEDFILSNTKVRGINSVANGFVPHHYHYSKIKAHINRKWIRESKFYFIPYRQLVSCTLSILNCWQIQLFYIFSTVLSMTVGVMCPSVPPHPKYQGKARCHKETVLGTFTAVQISDFANSAACSGPSLRSW
jgi:hypothetical protein